MATANTQFKKGHNPNWNGGNSKGYKTDNYKGRANKKVITLSV